MNRKYKPLVSISLALCGVYALIYLLATTAQTGQAMASQMAGDTIVSSSPGSYIESGVVSSQDLVSVDASPQISVTPNFINSTQTTNQITHHTINIQNSGEDLLNFDFGNDSAYQGSVLTLHLDEPAGSTIFYDSSGNNNHGSCFGDTCPQAGGDGQEGGSVFFDGIDDYIVIPDSQSLNPPGRITISAWVYLEDCNTNRRILQKGIDVVQYMLRCSYDMEGALQFAISGIGLVEISFPSQGAWHHVVAVFDGWALQLWVDGRLEGRKLPYNGAMESTSEPLYIGTWDAGVRSIDHLHGFLDEVVLFDRALSELEILALYHAASGFQPWLSVDPITGTVQTGSIQPVDITLDAGNLQPDIYETDLILENNDPETPLLQVPVTMTVEPTSSMGWVEGKITGLRSIEPVEATIIAAGQPYTVTSDPQSGDYYLWLEPGVYELLLSAPGYFPQNRLIEITSQNGITQDFTLVLDSAWIQVDQVSLSSTQTMETSTTHTLTISNAGTVPLVFNVYTGRIDTSDCVLMLHLDEPEGATTFLDSSGNSYHANCQADTCPTAGAQGIIGGALEFDGTDDFLEITSFPFGGPFTISAWVLSHNTSDYSASIMNFSNEANDNHIILGWHVRTGRSHFDIRHDDISTYMVTDDIFPQDEWVHIAAVVDENRIGYIYWDGRLIRTDAMEMPLNTTRIHHWLAKSTGVLTEYFDGLIDEFVLFDRALSPSEIHLLAEDTGEPSDWIGSEPLTGIVPAGGTFPIQVSLDAANFQPDTYQANLYIESNDPIIPYMPITVDMTVNPTASMGWVEGNISDLHSGEPLQATIVAVGQPYTVNSDPQDGSYQLWLEPGSYELMVSTPGYIDRYQLVEILSQQGLIQDITLLADEPWIAFDPESFLITQTLGTISQHTLTISNSGTLPLAFDIPIHRIDPSGLVLWMHFDDAAGSLLFEDSSIYGNDGFCGENSCPQAEEDGYIGDAISASSDDHIIEIPNAPSLNMLEEISISFWVNASAWDFHGKLLRKGYQLEVDRGVMIFTLREVGTVSTALPSTGMWHHLAATYDGSVMQIWVDGTLQVEKPASGLIYSNWYYILQISPQPGNRMDELRIYNRALSQDEIQILAREFETIQANSWLITEPISGTIAAGGSFPVQFTTHATGTAPGVYSQNLWIHSDDPLEPFVPIPVTMEVPPDTNMGWVAGKVSDLRTREPLAAIITAAGQPYTVTASFDTGDYQYWLKPGDYEIQATSRGYESQTVELKVTSKHGTNQDFVLVPSAPWIQVSPDSFSTTLFMGSTTNQTLEVVNAGASPLIYAFYDKAVDALQPAMALHLEEPYGSTTFLDDSGNGYDVICDHALCPRAGVEGILGTALEFNGRTYMVLPEPPFLSSGPFSISLWLKNHEIQSWGSILEFYSYGWWSDEVNLFLYWDADTGHLCFEVTNTNFSTNRIETDRVFPEDEWVHVVAAVDEQGMGTIYWNGDLVASGWLTVPESYPDRFIMGEWYDGLVDEVMFFDHGLTAAEVQMLYQGIGEASNWLATDPLTGTVQAGSSSPIQLQFDATNIQPDIYSGNLYLVSNDLVNPLNHIPVTMTVNALPTMGWVEGTITDRRNGEPLKATVSVVGQPYTVTSNNQTGYYQLWMMAGSHELQVEAPGYEMQTIPVNIIRSKGTILDIPLLLDAPWIQVSPESYLIKTDLGTVTTHTLTISNPGTASLKFNTWPGGLGLQQSVLALHLDETEGSITFMDNSGNGYHAICEESFCPTAGAAGVIDQALDFDGIDDYLELPPFALGGPFSASVWIYNRNVSAILTFIMDFNNNYEDVIKLDWFGSTERMRFGVMNDDASTVMYTWEYFPENEWVHVAAVVDEDGRGYIYWNGEMVEYAPMVMPGYTTRIYQWLGGKPSSTHRFDGLMDEFILYDRALTVGEIKMLAQSAGEQVGWLSSVPISGTIAAGSDLNMDVILDTRDLLPGIYTANLYVTSNDPRNPTLSIPITLEVEAIGNPLYLPLITK